MARKILKTVKGPFEIKPQKESAWICLCGLSKNQPFCDGAHKLCDNEEEGRIYEYDEQGRQKEIK